MDKKVCVTGSHGFFGAHLCRKLLSEGFRVVTVPHSDNPSNGVNLADTEHVSGCMYNLYHQDVKQIIHLAGYNGGIQFNKDNPFDIFVRNTQMGLNILSWAKAYKMDKVVSVLASCAYPSLICRMTEYECEPEDLMEQLFLHDMPHDSVACHGYAKRNLFLASKYAHAQYGLNAVCICPTTLYGPGDSFDVSRTKVMGGLINKFSAAKDSGASTIQMYGTGAALREFIYVEDAAKYAMLSLLKYNDSSMPLNIGTGQEISIKELAEKVAKAVKYNGKIKWGSSGEDGQLRKRLDTTRQKEILGDIPLTSLDEGIQKTVDWYNENRCVSR